MEKLERLTAEQAALLPVVRDEWLAHGLTARPADREAALAGVRQAYEVAGLEPPTIVVWLGSPYAGAVGSAMLAHAPDQVGDQVGDQVWDQVGDQVWDQVWDQVRAQVWDQVRDQVRAQVWDQVWDQVRAQVRDQVRAQVRDQVRDQVGDQVWAQVGAQVWAQVGAQVRAQVRDQVYRACYGQHDASWLAFYDAFLRLGVTGVDALGGQMAVARECGWWWPMRGAVVLTERPTVLQRDDDGRLHCEDGPALAYPDGWEIYAWHGVRVDERIITGQLTGKDWLEERNAEIRRIIAERMGYEWLLTQVKAERVAVDEYGTLWKISDPDGDDEDIVVVDVLNSTPEPDGSIKRYVLRVPPGFGEPSALPADAVGWTFQLAPGEYGPAVMT